MAALYSCAAQIVDKVTKKQGTAKNLAINSRFPKKKKLYALVCETLKCEFRLYFLLKPFWSTYGRSLNFEIC